MPSKCQTWSTRIDKNGDYLAMKANCQTISSSLVGGWPSIFYFPNLRSDLDCGSFRSHYGKDGYLVESKVHPCLSLSLPLSFSPTSCWPHSSALPFPRLNPTCSTTRPSLPPASHRHRPPLSLLPRLLGSRPDVPKENKENPAGCVQTHRGAPQ